MQNKQLSTKDISELLSDKNINPSYQRISILKFLIENREHFSADNIYKALVKEIPTLSKTTVYNTLSLLVEKKIVNTIYINNTEILYDYATKPHAHFQCKVCKKIYDVNFHEELYNKKQIDKHKIEEININLKGICKECKKN